MLEKRRRDRVQINRFAKFRAGLGTLPRDCLITDMSELGARLYTEHAVPDQFELVISAMTETRHECRVIWRLGAEVGVEFITVRPGNSLARRMADDRALAG